MDKKLMSLEEYIVYLSNLKLVLVNGKMVKQETPIIKNVEPIVITKKKKEKNFNETLDDICNLKLEIKGSKVKKLK